jgi:VanZ family protein
LLDCSPLQLRYRHKASIASIALFALLGFLFSIGFPEDRSLVVAILSGSAALLELPQYIAPDRHARVSDAIEKLVGGGVGMIAAQLLSFCLDSH